MRGRAGRLPGLRAIVAVPAHWIDDHIAVTAGGSLPRMHDFVGFPKPLYGLAFPRLG